MKTKLIDIQEDIKNHREIEKIQKEERKKLTRDMVKESVLKLLKELYPEELKDGIGKKNSVIFQSTTTQKNAMVKKKKRNFKFGGANIEEDSKISGEENSNEYIKNRIKKEYADVLEEFNMDVDNLIEYFDLIVKKKKNISDLILEENNEFELVKVDHSNDKLYDACLKILHNKESGLIPRKRLLRDQYEQEYEYYVSQLIESYLKKEEDEKYEMKFKLEAKLRDEDELIRENENQLNNRISIENEDFDDEIEELKPSISQIDYDERIPWWLRLTEFIIIVTLLIFNHVYINLISISDLNHFSSVMLSIFNSRDDCLLMWNNIQSYGPMNLWLLNCLVPT
jgi:hypothetical protein